MNNQSTISKVISWIFGIAVFAAGLLNLFWGNDPFFGVFLLLLSFIYFPPVIAIFQGKTGIKVPLIAKIVLAIFITWAVLGVGELFDKINLMMEDL